MNRSKLFQQWYDKYFGSLCAVVPYSDEDIKMAFWAGYAEGIQLMSQGYDDGD